MSKQPKPLTVGDLIAMLQKLPPTMPVMYHNWQSDKPGQYYTDGVCSTVFYVDKRFNALVTLPDDDNPEDYDSLVPLEEYP